MAMISGPFNSVNRDRLYGAEWFGGYFSDFIGNGVYPNPSTNFQVMANNDMTITVSKGKGYINGVKCEDKFNYIANIDVADGVLNRIDRIVLRLDTTLDRDIKVIVKKGTFASSPVAPTLQRDADAYELALADVYVGKGVISITQANITDLRLNSELCGIVHGVVDQVDTTTLFNQYASWYEQTTGQANLDIDTMLNQFMSDFNAWYTTNTTNWDSEFTTWFDSIKGQLEGDIAANLASQVTDLQTNKADKTDLVSLQTEVSEHVADNANYSTYKSLPDANGIFTKLEYKRPNGTLIMKSILSGGTSPEYATRTETEYEQNGTTVKATRVYAITYLNDKVTSEVLQ